MTIPPTKPPIVFISYSHDDPCHADRVLSLADALTLDGVEVLLDQYHPHPDEGWPLWMERSLDAAEFVLLICTPAYCRRVMRNERSDGGLGVQWEGNLIYNRIYQNLSQGSRFIPIVFTPDHAAHVPTPLQGHTRYHLGRFDLLDPDYEALYRQITQQPITPQPKRGEIQSLPPRRREHQPTGSGGAFCYLNRPGLADLFTKFGVRSGASISESLDRLLEQMRSKGELETSLIPTNSYVLIEAEFSFAADDEAYLSFNLVENPRVQMSMSKVKSSIWPYQTKMPSLSHVRLALRGTIRLRVFGEFQGLYLRPHAVKITGGNLQGSNLLD